MLKLLTLTFSIREGLSTSAGAPLKLLSLSDHTPTRLVEKVSDTAWRSTEKNI